MKLLEKPDGAEAQFRLRRTGSVQTVLVSKVINCTGPRSDYSKYQHPLLVNLLARGLIDHDPLALGITALPDGSVLRYRERGSGLALHDWSAAEGRTVGIYFCTRNPRAGRRVGSAAVDQWKSIYRVVQTNG